MSALAKQARSDMRAKATRMAGGDPSKKVDASDWTPPEPLNTYRKTGARPNAGPKIYKHGGKVQGDRGPRRADRSPRASGGKAGDGGLATKVANAYVNRDVRAANAEEFGSYHKGGFKRGGKAQSGPTPKKNGGRIGKWSGGPLGDGVPYQAQEGVPMQGLLQQALAQPRGAGMPAPQGLPSGISGGFMGGPMGAPMGGPPAGMPPQAMGGRRPAMPIQARGAMPQLPPQAVANAGGMAQGQPFAKGGRAKGKTNINIVIGHPGGQNQPPPSMMPGPVRPPMPIPVPAAGPGTPVPPMGGGAPPMGAMGPGGPPMGGMGGPGPLPGPIPMGRKSGGRAMAGNPPKTASSPKDMRAGGGGGLGRLEKASMQKKKH